MDRGGRGSHGCAGPRARALGARMRLANATKLPVCWQAAALPSPHLTANQRRAVRGRSRGLRGPPERSFMNDRWQASRLSISLCARVGQAPVLPFAARKTRPTRRQTAIVPHTNRAEFGGCPSSVRRLPHHWGPELAPRSVRRRDRARRCAVLCSRRATAAPGAREPVRTPSRSSTSRRTTRPPPTQ